MNTLPTLTRAEQRTYDALLKFHQENSYSPTDKELSDICGVHSNQIWRDKKRAFTKGWLIKKNRNVYLPIELTQ